ncbi:MAG: putative nucleic acid-binding protein [Paracoccaceae bacterium]|jgi:predicted nucleic acid-binding protein
MILCLDACVLYPTVMREILLGIARTGAFQPIWSARILEEWARAATRQNLSDEVIARGEIAKLRGFWPKAEVAADLALERQLWLPDANDIHVLATAISAGAEAIVTFNLRDFPARELADQGQRACHPDTFLLEMWRETPEPVETVIAAVLAEARRLSGTEMPFKRLMKRAQLPRLSKAMSAQ